MRKSKFLFALVCILILQLTSSASSRADISLKDYAPYITFWWDAPSYTGMTWLTREVTVTETGDASYFSIMGSFSPPFYLGIQDFDNAKTGQKKKVAIFSAWDTYENNDCTNCTGDSAPSVGRTTIKDLGPGVRAPGRFGNEGTGVNSFIDDFGWKVGDTVRAVVNLRPVADGTEISAALQINSEKWRYFGTYKYSKIYSQIGRSYSFIEDFGQTPMIVRSAEFGNTWMESEDISRVVGMTSVTASPSKGGSQTEINVPYHRIEQKIPSGLWAQSGGNETSTTKFVRREVTLPANSLISVEARIAVLNISGQAKSDYEVTYRKNLEARKSLLEDEETKARLQAAVQSYGSLDNYMIYSDPDPSEAAGFLTRNRFNYNTKQIRVVKSYPGTNFLINGSYGSTPGFVGGIQETSEGTRQVFLTAYNLDESTCKLVICVPRISQRDWNVEVLSSELVTQKVEFVTHIDLYSRNITWAPGEVITWLTVLSPEKSSSLLTVAVKVGTGAWQHLATIRYPAIYDSGLAGGYGGIVEPSSLNPFISRVAEYSPTVLENFLGEKSILTNLYLLGPKEKTRHSFVVNSFGLKASVGIEAQLNTQSEYRIALSKSSDLPPSLEGQLFVQDILVKLSPSATEYRQSVEAKVAAELKAKQEAAAKAAVAVKKTTITCIKGKLIKKVTAVKPVCPAGYKKK